MNNIKIITLFLTNKKYHLWLVLLKMLKKMNKE